MAQIEVSVQSVHNVMHIHGRSVTSYAYNQYPQLSYLSPCWDDLQEERWVLELLGFQGMLLSA